MKLNNNALQELYDTMMNLPLSTSPYGSSPIDEAFRECDEKLSESVTFEEIRSLRKANANLLSSNLESISKERKLKKEIDGLHKHLDILSANEREALSASKKLEKDLDDAKKNVEYFRHSRDDWRSRAKYAEDEVKELKETLEKANADRTELQKDRDSYHGLYTELSKAYDKLFEENKKLKARTDCLRMEVEWYRKHYRENFSTLLDSTRDAGYKQGQNDLWDKLKEVANATSSELLGCFTDVCELDDLIEWEPEDFMDEYKKWQEEKEKERLDHMRDYLARFCEGRVCEACPLESNEFKCGCGYSFKKSADWDIRIIPDEELEKYYEKARGCSAYNLKDGKLFIHDLSHPMAGVNEAIKNACEKFTKAVEAANINISTRAWHGDAIAEKIKIEPWSCTLEGTINVEFDRDLLEKVCGVKLDDK